MTNERKRVLFIVCLIIITVLTVSDQLLKFAVVKNITLNEIHNVITIGGHKIFSLTHVKNSGAAWSVMAGKSWFLIGIPVIIIIIGMIYLFKKRHDSKFLTISLSMLLAGGIANLIDRIRLHEVIDYIKFEPINFPVFNFADICIVIGGILFCIYFIIIDEIKKKKASIGVKNEQD